MTEQHSPLGGSGASRWIACPGSVYQSQGAIKEESIYALEGSAAHEIAAICLTEDREPWEFVGGRAPSYPEIEIKASAAVHIDSYVQFINNTFPNRNSQNFCVEFPFQCPSFHELYYGKADIFHLANRILDVVDFKFGIGVVVEAIENKQTMYYGAGVCERLDLWPHIDLIRLHIHQPRAWHPDGPHRVWEIKPRALEDWVLDECVPAMNLAMVSKETKSGDHCQFCPANSRQCPSIMRDMDELDRLMTMAEEKGAEALTSYQIRRLLELKKLGAIVFKAAEKEATRRIKSGKKIKGCKVVAARSNRQFKPGAEAAVKAKFGKKAYTKPVLKTPAQIEEMPGGERIVSRWSFKPKGATVVVPDSDHRMPLDYDRRKLFKPQKEK